jgi:hypothetical protein
MAFIKRRIKPGDKIEVLTYHRDIHGRYIGDIFYGDPKKFFNRECIESGYASGLSTPSCRVESSPFEKGGGGILSSASHGQKR